MPEAIAGIDKPVVCSFMGAKDVAAGAAILRKAGVPNYPFPEDGVKSLAAAHWLVSSQEIPRREMPVFTDLDVEGARRIVAGLLDGHAERYLTQAECRPLLGCYRLPLLKSEVAHDADEAAAAADSIGGPVVMKVMSADVVHKYDAGGVILNVHGGEEARAAYHKIIENVAKRRARRQDRGHPRRSHGPQGRRGDPRRQPRRAVRPADDVRPGRHAGRSPQGRLLPPGADVADFGRADGPPDPLLQGARRLPRQSALRRRRDRRHAPAALGMVCNHPEISECDINPLIVHAKRRGLLRGRQPDHAAAAGVTDGVDRTRLPHPAATSILL